MIVRLAAGALACAVIAAGTGAQAEELRNGFFRTGPQPSTTVVAGSTSIPHWAVGKHSIDYYADTHWQNPPGANRSIDLNGSPSANDPGLYQPGSLTQSFHTAIGQSYTLSFYFSGSPDLGPKDCQHVRTMAVRLPAMLQILTWDVAAMGNTAQDMKWTAESYTFTATDTISSVSFASRTAGRCGPAIGAVSVTENTPG